MKKLYVLLLGAMMAVTSAYAYNYDDAARQAYYLTDKMAYELNLSNSQYDRVYQINLDYFLRCDSERDLYGYLWEYRNSALARVLHTRQWRKYNGYDYFYRPLRWVNGVWHLICREHYPRHHYYRPTPPPSYKGPKPGEHRHDYSRPDYRPGYGVGHNDGHRGGTYTPQHQPSKPQGHSSSTDKYQPSKPQGHSSRTDSYQPSKPQGSTPGYKAEQPQKSQQGGYRGGTRTSSMGGRR